MPIININAEALRAIHAAATGGRIPTGAMPREDGTFNIAVDADVYDRLVSDALPHEDYSATLIRLFAQRNTVEQLKTDVVAEINRTATQADKFESEMKAAWEDGDENAVRAAQRSGGVRIGPALHDGYIEVPGDLPASLWRWPDGSGLVIWDNGTGLKREKAEQVEE